MKATLKVLVAAVAILGMSMQADALPITPSAPLCTAVDPDPTVCLVATGAEDDNSETAVKAALEYWLGAGYVDIYKSNAEGGEAGEDLIGTDHYSTDFIPDVEPEGASIVNDGTLHISSGPIYLVVKDGAHDPSWYIFQILVGGANWDGEETLSLSGFWPDGGAISNVSIHGVPGATPFVVTTVPDGGSTAMLLGVGFMFLAAGRRILSRN